MHDSIIQQAIKNIDNVIHNELFLSALNNISDSVVIIDANGEFVFTNTATFNILGYPQDALLGKHWHLVYRQKVLTKIPTEFDRHKLAQGPQSGEVELVKANGQVLRGRFTCMQLQHGHIILLFHDATKHIEYEQVIQRKDEAIESIMDGIALLSGDHYYYLNTAHVQIFGYDSAEELIGSSWKTIYTEEEAERLTQEVFPIIAEKGFWRGQTLGKKKDGTPIWQELALTVISDGSLVCVCRDITKQKKQETELARLAVVASKTNNGVVVANADGCIEYTNDAFQNLLGRKHQLCLFKELGFSTDVQNEVMVSMRSYQSRKLEVCINNGSNKPVWMIADINPVFEGEKLVNIICVLSDITMLKDAEDKILVSLQKEKELNDLKSRFVGLVSHEFRTPLTGIQMSIDIMRSYISMDVSDLQNKMDRQLLLVSNEVFRMGNLLNDVLVAGKISAGKIEVRPKKNYLCRLVQDILDNPLYFSDGDTQISFVVQGESKAFSFDERLMEHVVKNLLSNAVKFSIQGRKNPSILLHFKQEEVALEVVNYGIGIPKMEQEKIFQSFYRASNAEFYNGTGLGLSIVKQFVELQGGKVTVKSILDKNTTFTIKFPINVPEDIDS